MMYQITNASGDCDNIPEMVTEAAVGRLLSVGAFPVEIESKSRQIHAHGASHITPRREFQFDRLPLLRHCRRPKTRHLKSEYHGRKSNHR